MLLLLLFLGVSPANSGTVESLVFDDTVPQPSIVNELTTPKPAKLDLLIQTKTLGNKVNHILIINEIELRLASLFILLYR